jgi:hypothetical protein
MDGPDDQTTCGHELISNDSDDLAEGNETHAEGDGETRKDAQLDEIATAMNIRRTAPGIKIQDDDSHESRLHTHGMEETEAHGVSQKQNQVRTSLEDLEERHHFQTWPGRNLGGAIESPLPPSAASSMNGIDSLEVQQLSQTRSLEELMLRPDHVALPQEARGIEQPEALPEQTFWKQESGVYDQPDSANGSQTRSLPNQKRSGQKLQGSESKRPGRSKLWDKVLAALGSSGRIQETRKQRATQAAFDLVGSEAEIYRTNLTKWATHFPNLDNVNTGLTRHAWSSRIVYFDTTELQQSGAALPQEPWPGLLFPPAYEEFHRTLRHVPSNCLQRLILVEDLNPSLIDFLGAAFHIPPHVFEEHLDGSGYTITREQRDNPTRWQKHFFAQGSSSITWFRPVVPLLPIDPLLRENILRDQNPEVRCIFDDCQRQHFPRVRTTANIWRRNLALCPHPGGVQKDSEAQYPVAWEQRVTIWTREFDDCEYGKQP